MSQTKIVKELLPTDGTNLSLEELAKTKVNAKLSVDDKLKIYTDMGRIRAFESRSLRAYQMGKIGGFLHTYEGEESVAVGTVSLCGKYDHIITAYRCHGFALAVGMSMNNCMAEMFGKHTGCSKGKGGSMHLFAPDKNYWGGHGIVGGQIPLGLGIAYGLKYKGQKGCCLAFMGDGAMNQGVIHESMNLAGLWDVPVIFVIENNHYSMGTSQVRSSAYDQYLAKRGEAYGIEWDIVNGNVLYDVRYKTQQAIERAHKDSRPTVLEMFTYRYRGHSVADANAEKYRDKEEIQNYKSTQDPITMFKDVLIAEGLLDQAKAKEIDGAARQEAEEASKYADQSPYPPPESILEDVYWDEDNRNESTSSSGRIVFEDGGIFDK